MNRLFGMGYRPAFVENASIAFGIAAAVIVALAQHAGALA